MTTRAQLLITAVAVFVLAAPTFSQQPAPERQREDDVPTLTTEDVAPPPVEGQPAGALTETPEGQDPSMTPEERADAEAAGGDAAAGKGGKGTGAKPKPTNAAEAAWRRQYAAAESAYRAAEKRAQEAELRSNELRNSMATAGSTDERNSLAAENEQQGEAVRQAQAAAAAARAAFDRVRAEGTARKFTLAPGPAPTKGGQPNPTFYQERVASTRSAYEDATRRVELYQARVNDARGRILNNSGSGDNYAQARIQTDLDEALKELERAQSDLQTAQEQHRAAVDAAVRAGIPVPR
jgi:hypothetical protein